jgi:hypothetical protein
MLEIIEKKINRKRRSENRIRKNRDKGTVVIYNYNAAKLFHPQPQLW